MGSIAVTLTAIDQALLTKYSGITIPTGPLATPTAVEVFMEQPSIEEFEERTFPSVSLKMMSVTPDYSRIVDSDDEEEEEVAYDDTETPPVRSMRKRPQPFRIQYSIDTWHKALVAESRDLISEVLMYRTCPRGFLTVANIDGENVDVWLFWEGGFVTSDELHSDEIIYHKTLTLVVVAYLALSAVDDVDEEKVVTEAQVEVSLRSTWRDQGGHPLEIQVDDTKNVLDLVIGVTETDEEPI